MEKPKCKECGFLECTGRTNSKHSGSRHKSRKTYFCKHPETKEITDRGLPLFPFVGYGDTSYESPLQLATCKKWCPILQHMKES